MGKREKKSNNENKESKVKISKKNVIIIVCVLVVLVLIVMPMFLRPKKKPVEIKTEAIEKRDIAKSISATGTIQTSTSKDFVSTLMGTKVKSVNVKEGQKVNVGDVICTFDTEKLNDSLNSINTSINTSNKQTQHSQDVSQRNLNELRDKRNKQANDGQNAINSAKSNLDQLQKAYNAANARYQSAEKAMVGPLKDELAKIRAEKDKLMAEKNAIESSNSIDTSNSIGSTNSVGGIIEGKPTVDVTTITKAINDKSNEEKAKEAEIAAAEAKIQNVITDKKTAETAYINAKTTYEKLVQTQETTLATLDSQIKSMEDTINGTNISKGMATTTQEMQRKDLNRQLSDSVIKSDVAGTVTKVNVKKGDIYSNGVIATVDGCEEFIIESQIEEYDIPDIEVGMKVLIKTDATRDEELSGTVTYVASNSTSNMPSGTSAVMGVSAPTGGKATYLVKISLDTPNDRLRLGMNAKLSIITNMKENVLSVPYDSVLTREDGQKYIKVLKDKESKEIEEIDIKTGIEGTYYVEAISDKIKEGMQVVKPEVASTNSIEELLSKMGPQAGM